MNINWSAIFLSDLDLPYAVEIAIRTLLMFTFILIMLRLSGKKGVRQLSLFEVAIIIALGSAAGDPMFNQGMGILSSLLVFTVILIFYRTITYFTSKSEGFENLIEGEPMYIIEDGRFTMQEEHTFAKDEFFAEMRSRGVEHVGQVKTAILETNGTVSFFFFADDDVRPGLPVLPKAYRMKNVEITNAGKYACTYCAEVDNIEHNQSCVRCGHKEWVPALETLRIT